MTRDGDPAIDGELAQALGSLAPSGMIVSHRLISAGDDLALLESEAKAFMSAVPKVRRASGAARVVARALLEQLGASPVALPKAASGAPVWPEGFIGSLAHDDRVAVAVVGRRGPIRSIGIDVEPAAPLPPDLLTMVVTPKEREQFDGDPLRARILFAAKEAAYKAAYPLDGLFLDYPDIVVDLASGTAATRTGHTLMLRVCVSTHIVALAWIA